VNRRHLLAIAIVSASLVIALTIATVPSAGSLDALSLTDWAEGQPASWLDRVPAPSLWLWHIDYCYQRASTWLGALALAWGLNQARIAS
jgi:hypothetical protein